MARWPRAVGNWGVKAQAERPRVQGHMGGIWGGLRALLQPGARLLSAPKPTQGSALCWGPRARPVPAPFVLPSGCSPSPPGVRFGCPRPLQGAPPVPPQLLHLPEALGEAGRRLPPLLRQREGEGGGVGGGAPSPPRHPSGRPGGTEVPRDNVPGAPRERGAPNPSLGSFPTHLRGGGGDGASLPPPRVPPPGRLLQALHPRLLHLPRSQRRGPEIRGGHHQPQLRLSGRE